MKKEEKTNVMRVLDSMHAEYKKHTYESDGAVDGVTVARLIGKDEPCVFKTLVCVGKSKNHYVFVIPVARELDLKKAASAAGEKNIEMVKSRELLPLTGYVHGGCSPIGMKKFFKTCVDESARNCETVVFSAGRIGFQVEMSPDTLSSVIRLDYADLVKEEF